MKIPKLLVSGNEVHKIIAYLWWLSSTDVADHISE